MAEAFAEEKKVKSKKEKALVIVESPAKSKTIKKILGDSYQIEASFGHVRNLPDKYNTVLSEGGSNLSQGEKQLICIARVMLLKPPMLILDEATSSIFAVVIHWILDSRVSLYAVKYIILKVDVINPITLVLPVLSCFVQVFAFQECVFVTFCY